jgi:two-component system LytT family sensor kinase
MLPRITYQKLRPYVHIAVWLLFAIKMASVILDSGPVWGWYFFLYMLTLIGSTYFNFCYLIPRYFATYRYRRYFALFFLEWAVFVLFLFGLVWFFDHYPKPFPNKGGMYIVAFVNFTLELFLITLAKLAKELYLKSQRGRQYQMEKLHAELQFLRTQLNPHFLFNTLNNIYALVTTKSDKAGDSILLLSNLLHYLLYETNADKVKLSNELTFIKTYIDLERLRLDESQPVNYHVHGNEEGMIAPLILFNFIENAFKHATRCTKSTRDPPFFIDIDISLHRGMLTLSVANSYKPKTAEDKASYGIGIENARKRLYLIYENNYLLDVQTTPDVYHVLLKIPYHDF